MASMSSRGSALGLLRRTKPLKRPLLCMIKIPLTVGKILPGPWCVPLLGEAGGQRGCVRESDLLRRRSTVKEKMKLLVWDLERLWV
ncbi:hypothetical protein RHSIM_Rhsim07G0075500 [Rhododendron simsii]|uniref:Uncharacterized protein n=1 Tax=Rhododendron simsii TaxID=118357 RepID=A0A834GRU4_RHOSS|nr:hypothetical protein RHSIM_Rhsim07G0075500 [Rhododendron simsii]